MSRDTLMEFLERRLGLDPAEVTDDTALFSSGMLDSFSLVDLIVFIEKETKTKLSPRQVRLENLDTIAKILEFAEAQGRAA
jgi:acyl carrier protein